MKSLLFIGILFLLAGAGLGFVAFNDGAAAWVDANTSSACTYSLGKCSSSVQLTAKIVAGVFLPLGLLFTWAGVYFSSGRSTKGGLLGTGLAGRATVMGVADTGTGVNANPLVELQLQLEVEGRAPIVITHRTVVPRLVVGRLAPGTSLPVWVDHRDPTKLEIDWSKV